jgi:2-methylcitrate dehydratase PrpD
VVAYALLCGQLPTTAFSEVDPEFEREDVGLIARRVTTVERAVPPIGKPDWRDGYACVQVKMTNGSTHERRTDAPPGHASNPASTLQLETKISDCLDLGGFGPDPATLMNAVRNFVVETNPLYLSRAAQELRENPATTDLEEKSQS